MADTNLNVRIKNAYKTESEWSVTTTIPKNGELLFTKGGLHDGEYKIGDGTHRWSDLDYIKPSYTYPELEPLMTKTYNNVICTANSDPAGYLYFMTIKPDNYNTAWTIRYRVHATIAGVTGGYQDSEVLIEGTRNTYLAYSTYNAVNNTSYRPYYSHMYFAANETGQTNNYPHLLGFRFQSSYNPATTANSRTIVIEILEYKNCTPTFLDTMKLFADMPGSNSTNYGNTSSGANATRYSFDGVTQGWTFSGDRNTYPYLLSAYYTRPYVGVNGTKQYGLAMEDSVGRLQSFTTTHGTGTSKAKNTQGFRLGRMYYLNTGNNYTEGQQFGNDISRLLQHDMDLRYSTNCGTTLTAFKPLYIVGTYNQSDGLFYLADTWWTQTLPTSEDGKIYIYIGCPYDTYRLTFEGYHDPVWYKNNAIRQFIPEATSAVGGAMSSADKTKLNGIATGAEVNQNTFAKVAVGSTTIEADAKQDTLTFAAGSNVTITPDATNDKVTIAATDTTYTFTNGLSASGTTVSNSGVRSIGTGSANGTISVNTNGTSADVSVKGLGSLAYASTVPVATSSAIGGVKSGTDISIDSSGNVSVVDNSHNHTIANVTNLQTNLDAKAPKASPALTGTPTAPTATAGTNTTQIATTAFVNTAIDNATNNVEIGGRNYIKNSKFTKPETSYGAENCSYSIVNDATYGSCLKAIFTAAGRFYYNTTKLWRADQKYAVSFLVKTDDSGVTIRPSRSVADFGVIMDVTSTWTKYTGIINCTVDNDGGTLSFSVNKACTIYITYIKLEKGNKSTDWTPAPEDLVSSLSISNQTLNYNNYLDTPIGNITLSKSNVGLSNVDNKSSATIRGELTASNVTTALSFTPVNKAGDTMTGTLVAPIIQTGTATGNYFQSQKFRGEGDANTYYHAIDFGYSGHNQVDFYEYGGLYNFWKNTSANTSNAILLGKITTNGWEGNVVGHASLDLPLTGGTMTGPIKWSDNTALPQATSANYLLTIDAFADGGTQKWISTSNVTVGSATNATNATKATQDESGNNIKASYAASFSISDHTITLKNKNGTSLGTVTVPDNNTTYSAGTGISLSGTTFSNSGVRSVATGSTNGTIAVNTNGTTSDVAVKGLQALAYKASLSKSDVGLGNVDNTSDLNKPLSTATQSALASKLSLTGGTVTGPTDFEDSVSIDDLNVGTIVVTGAASFVNGINANQLTGSIPSALLPSYVDDVLEYNSSANFPSTGEAGKIYVATNTNLTYRWSGSAYVEISPSLALGTTSSTAYRGDYGNTAYAHATDSSRLTTAKSSGFYKIATTAQGHVASVTAVTKGDLTALGVITGGSNAKSAVTISPTTTSVYSMTTDGAVTAGTANVPTKIDTTKFNAGSFTRGTFSQGTLPTLTFSIDANDSGNLKIGFSQGTLPTHAADSYTAPSLGSGFYTAGTANTPTAVTLPTRTQVSGLWNGYNTGVNNTFAAAQTFTGSTT